MTEVLGHARYGAHGGDVGAGVTTRLGALFPEALAGIHLTAIGPPAELDEATLSDAERAHRDHLAAWASDGGAYHHQQRTRPMTLAYGLTDSPAGLLAWIVEKLRAWSDCGGDLATRFTDDEVLTWVSLYWLTDSIATSFRPYNDGYARPESTPQVSVPAALAVFPGDISQPPRAWAERSLLALARYTPMPRGGHFAGWEEPALLAADIAAFFDELR
jgi:pimeloyl-ACP methyl ester carboxylesterase